MNKVNQEVSRYIPAELQNLLDAASSSVSQILTKALFGNEISEIEGAVLFNCRDKEKDTDRAAIFSVADILRQRSKGDYVTFVVNRNINFTNICYMGCRFCGFAKRKEDSGSEWLEPSQVVERAQQAWDRGGTEVCIQGGLHPKMEGNYYRELLLAIKAALPDMHIHAFSPFEVWYGAVKSKLSYRDLYKYQWFCKWYFA